MKVLSCFRRILGSFWGPSRYETARWGARSGTVRRPISSVWSDLWRSKRVSWPLHRSQMSNVSSDAVTAISRELARPGIIWPSLHADEGGAAERLRRHPRLRKRAPAACTPRVLRPALWSCWKRSESTPWSVPAVDSHFGRGPTHGRAIELEGGGGARRGAISVH